MGGVQVRGSSTGCRRVLQGVGRIGPVLALHAGEYPKLIVELGRAGCHPRPSGASWHCRSSLRILVVCNRVVATLNRCLRLGGPRQETASRCHVVVIARLAFEFVDRQRIQRGPPAACAPFRNLPQERPRLSIKVWNTCVSTKSSIADRAVRDALFPCRTSVPMMFKQSITYRNSFRSHKKSLARSAFAAKRITRQLGRWHPGRWQR